jgi:hypothetical protein
MTETAPQYDRQNPNEATMFGGSFVGSELNLKVTELFAEGADPQLVADELERLAELIRTIPAEGPKWYQKEENIRSIGE